MLRVDHQQAELGWGLLLASQILELDVDGLLGGVHLGHHWEDKVRQRWVREELFNIKLCFVRVFGDTKAFLINKVDEAELVDLVLELFGDVLVEPGVIEVKHDGEEFGGEGESVFSVQDGNCVEVDFLEIVDSFLHVRGEVLEGAARGGKTVEEGSSLVAVLRFLAVELGRASFGDEEG